MPVQRLTVKELYRWGYQNENRGIQFLTNVIQCGGCHKAKKMHGLYNLTQVGREVSTGNTLFDVRIDGVQFDMAKLEEFA